ncbi:pyruvate phosphate dikinase-like enzyme [Kribbella steppae]|uniref:Phosphoenolpyruvate synthase n=1 Tax=Kribbella steppae TaxID=2512223 RepID=A0A4R2H4H6_9ACTN|nr:PEP/pyruvate-binding domain-containing protein [Kribbella steppae]TCO20397.1 pyruvate phosphate dikinase-like enzyme [Kribbella steppae]
MNQSSITWLNRPARLVSVKQQKANTSVQIDGARVTRVGMMPSRGDARGSTGFAVTAAAYREFVRSARLRPYIASELRRWRDGRDLTAVGAAIRTAFADAELPATVADAIAAGYARLGGDGTVVSVRSIGPSGVPYRDLFEDVDTTHDLLAACRRCFAAPFADWAINDREDRGVSQLDVAVSVGIERAAAADTVVPSAFAPTPGDCAGYVLDNSELLRLAAWAVAAERNHLRHQGAR